MSEGANSRMPADPVEEQIKMRGGLSVWQGAAAGLGGMLLTAAMSVNTLLERSQADQARLKEVIAELRALSIQVQHLSTEVTRQGVYISDMRANDSPTSGIARRRN